jgi:NTE family protein
MLKWVKRGASIMGERTALVLSAGMMFGAYQAGVWKALAAVFEPDMVIGVSSGALNGWAIAGGCDPDDLVELWRQPSFAGVSRLHFPFPPWEGVFNSRLLKAVCARLHSRFHPQVEVGIAATDLLRMRPRLFKGKEIKWQHLAASCSIPFGFRPVSIEGRLYIDGGFLGVLPLWAASQMGATKAVAICALPRVPSRFIRSVVTIARFLAPRLPGLSPELQVRIVAPTRPMGSMIDLTLWRRDNIERWIELGRKDGEKVVAELESDV